MKKLIIFVALLTTTLQGQIKIEEINLLVGQGDYQEIVERLEGNIVADSTEYQLWFALGKAYDDLKEPNCSYHCITMSWPCLSFDGCVHVDEAIISKKHHTHLKIADHRTIFANPRLVYHVNQILNKESEV